MTAAEVVPFQFESNEIRTVTVDGEIWFIAKDVCDVLEYANSRKALADHLDDDEKGVTNCDTLGGSQQMTVINESGLYTLILRSNKPQAKPFRKWVTAEVLPAIRRTGFYQQPAQPRKPESLLPVAREFRAALRLSRAMGLKGVQAIQAAGRLACKQTGVDPLELFDPADFLADESETAETKRPARRRARQ